MKNEKNGKKEKKEEKGKKGETPGPSNVLVWSSRAVV